MKKPRKLDGKYLGGLRIFKYIDSLPIDKSLLSHAKGRIFFVVFCLSEHMHGDKIPLGVFEYCGTIMYMLGDDYFTDINLNDSLLNHRISKQIANMQKLINVNKCPSRQRSYNERMMYYDKLLNVIKLFRHRDNCIRPTDIPTEEKQMARYIDRIMCRAVIKTHVT